jgi:hypothetical protein
MRIATSNSAISQMWNLILYFINDKSSVCAVQSLAFYAMVTIDKTASECINSRAWKTSLVSAG